MGKVGFAAVSEMEGAKPLNYSGAEDARAHCSALPKRTSTAGPVINAVRAEIAASPTYGYRRAGEMDIEPAHTQVCIPQSNAIAESFVNTLKRDYVSPTGARADAKTPDGAPGADRGLITVIM